jgi:hypothetical protein
MAEHIPRGDLLSPPGNAYGRAAVTYCCGLAQGIITAAGTVMIDKTEWSCPIIASRMTA